MKVYEVKYIWSDPHCDCVSCLISRKPHPWSSETRVEADSIAQAARVAEDKITGQLQPGLKHEVYSIAYVTEYDEKSTPEASLLAEDELMTHEELQRYVDSPHGPSCNCDACATHD